MNSGRKTGWLFLFMVLLSVAVCGPSCGTASAQEGDDVLSVDSSPVRTWSSPDGKFKREGRLVEILGDRVKLEMTDGKSTIAQAAKLSPADQKFIAAERARMKANSDNPFMDEDSADSGKSASRGTGDTESDGGARSERDSRSADNESSGMSEELDVTPEFATAEIVDLDSTTAVDTAAAIWQPTAKKPTKKIRFPAFSIHSSVTGHACSAEQTMFAVSLKEPFGVDLKASGENRGRGRSRPAEEGAKTKAWIEIVDLGTAKSKARIPLRSEEEVLGDLNDAGTALITYCGDFAQDPKVRVYRVNGDQLVLAKSWLSKNPDEFRSSVKSVKWLSNKRVLVEYEEYLMVLQLDPVRTLFKIPNDAPDWKLSTDRSRVLVNKQGQKFEVDLKAGECVGIVGGAAVAGKTGASPDGSKVGKFENSVLTLRDQQGQILDEFYCPVFWPEPQLSWIDERTILLRSPNLEDYVDLDRRVVFLQVANVGAQPSSDGWSVKKISDAGAYLVEVTPEAQGSKAGLDLAGIQKELPADADSLLLLKAGDSVRITTQLQADPSQAATVRQRIEGLLQKRGVTVDPNAANEIRISSAIRNEQVEYSSFGFGGPGSNAEKVNVRITDQKVELVIDGEVVWVKASSSGPGFMLQMREGETAQQAADRQTGNGAGFWESISFPKNLSRHPNGGAWNRVMQTNDGFQKIN